MSSKASKLRVKRAARAGRPKKENVERYPSGQIKHGEREKDVMATVLEARKRIHGIDSKSIYAGYVLGRIYLDGKISECEREAGDEYAAAMARYYALTGIPFPSARAQSIFSIKGHDGDVSEDRAKRARSAANRMMEIEGILLRLPEGPRIKTTCFNVCVLDIETMRTMPDEQIAMLRRGLREIHYHLGLGKSRSTA